MQASQILSSQASPTAPGPQGDQPTIAGRINDQIKQTAQPQPQQGGIAGLNPSMRDIGKQAGVASQIMAQKQAQQQQQAQNPEAVAQMAAQMLQSKGVAGLPANMGFKEGGIIGFDGTQGSAVNLNPEQVRQKLAEAVRNRDIEGAQFYAKWLQDNAMPDRPQAPRVVIPRGMREPVRAVAMQDIKAVGEPNITPAEADAGLENRPTAQAPAAAVKPPAPPMAPPVASPMAAATGSAPRAAAATPRPEQQGIASVIPETTIKSSGIVEPSIASISGDIDKLAPKRAENFNKQMEEAEEKRAKLKAGMADLNAEEIKALEESKGARKQIAASKAERDQFNRVQSFFKDLYTRGDSYGNVQNGIFAREEAERLADENHSKAVILLKKAQQAEQLGDLDRATALKKEAYTRLGQEDKNRSDAAKIAGELAVSRYGQQMETARTQGQIDSARVRTQAEINQRNNQLMANLRIEEQKVAGMSEERKNTRQGQALTAALGRLNDATRNLTKVSDDNKLNLGMKDNKDPTAQAMYKQAEKTVSTAQSTYDEAKRIFDSIAAEALKGYATTPTPTGGAKIDAAAAAAELARRQQK